MCCFDGSPVVYTGSIRVLFATGCAILLPQHVQWGLWEVVPPLSSAVATLQTFMPSKLVCVPFLHIKVRALCKKQTILDPLSPMAKVIAVTTVFPDTSGSCR